MAAFSGGPMLTSDGITDFMGRETGTKPPKRSRWAELLARNRKTAPAPVDPGALLGGPAPPDALKDSSAAQQAAIAAAARQRRKAGGGGRHGLPGQPIGAGMNPGATLQPRSLLGY